MVSRRRLTLFSLFVVLAAAWLLRTSESSLRVAGESAQREEDSPSKPGEGPSRSRASSGAQSEMAHEPPSEEEPAMLQASSLIESVRLEPEEACVGDEVLVYATLHPHADGSKIFVNQRAGSPCVIFAREAGPQKVLVLAQDWAQKYDRRVLTLQVRDCPDPSPKLRARITAQRVGERRYLFTLSPVPQCPISWDLGDGGELEGPVVSHGYASRAERPVSTYLVQARYTGPHGPEVSRLSVTHVEAVGLAARSPYPILESEGERFVRFGADEALHTVRRLKNVLAEDVTFQAAQLRAMPCDGSRAEVVEMPADQLLDVTRLRPSEERDIQVHIPGAVFDKPICEIMVRAAGTAGSRVVSTMFTLDTGVPDTREPIEDPALLDALRALALERGTTAPITHEELVAYRARLGSD